MDDENQNNSYEEIKPIQISSVGDFLNKLSTPTGGEDAFFRGHKRRSYELIPSLFRTSPKVNWVSYGNKLIQIFLRNAGRYVDNLPSDAYAIKALAQHHGVPTDLLDWSLNPLVALFFAVEDLEVGGNEESAIVWRCIGGPIERESHPEFPVGYDISPNGSYFIPPVINARMAAQQGCFTVMELSQYYPKNGERCDPLNLRSYSKPICYEIKHEDRKKFQKELNALGVNYSTIYPDLEGLAMHISWEARL